MKISEDKKTITLDIPLGTEVYTYSTNCNNTCYRDDNDNMKGTPSAHLKELEQSVGVRCDQNAPCHVVFTGTQHEKLTIGNCERICPLLGKKYFLSNEDARKAGIELAMQHRETLRKNGLPFGEHQKSLIERDYLAGVRTDDSIALGREIDRKTAPDYDGEED